MLSTINQRFTSVCLYLCRRVTSIYVRPMCTCYGQWERHQWRHVYFVHVMNMRVASVYVSLLCTCTEQCEQLQCMHVRCVHAMNMRTTSIIICMSTVYMQWTMRATSIYACLLCSCCGKLEQHQRIHVYSVHAVNDKSINSFYLSSTLYISTIKDKLCSLQCSRTLFILISDFIGLKNLSVK